MKYDNSYEKTLCTFLNIIKKLDRNEYNSLLNKYKFEYDGYYIKNNFKENDYINIFIDIGNYILSKTNKDISLNKILMIANNKNLKLKLNGIDKIVTELNLNRQNSFFPYSKNNEQQTSKSR